MMKNDKKSDAEKKLNKFRNQLQKLLDKYPEIQISGNRDGDPIAYIPSGDLYSRHEQIYLPTNSKQELIIA